MAWVGVFPGGSLESIVKYASFCKEISPICEYSIILLVVHWTFWIRLICYWFISSLREIHGNKWIWLKILFAEENGEVWIENRGEKKQKKRWNEKVTKVDWRRRERSAVWGNSKEKILLTFNFKLVVLIRKNISFTLFYKNCMHLYVHKKL